jgi:hypothetical protein
MTVGQVGEDCAAVHSPMEGKLPVLVGVFWPLEDPPDRRS